MNHFIILLSLLILIKIDQDNDNHIKL